MCHLKKEKKKPCSLMSQGTVTALSEMHKNENLIDRKVFRFEEITWKSERIHMFFSIEQSYVFYEK